MGSISGEWNAWETVSGSTRIPLACKAALTFSTSVAAPEITVLSGPLTAATASEP